VSWVAKKWARGEHAVNDAEIDGYGYDNADLGQSHNYLLPAVRQLLGSLRVTPAKQRLFELGSGNGSVANALTQLGWAVTGVDSSIEGTAQDQAAYPELKLSIGSAYDDLAAQYGQFPVVLSLEVIEHVYAPRAYIRTVFDLLDSGGTAIISTPYHGYWKNLALALTGKMDAHFTALWDNGHIKFWSIRTLDELLHEAGFVDIRFERVGRVPALAKSMIAIARKPGQ
jgi:2-polyprenyl-3-methyl-5-hydroxy-6-metoxy-1,4-benzoquinol methylase